MGYRSYLILALLFAFALPVAAQQTNNRGEIVMSKDEFKSLARKLAELRAQRVALMQQRQAQWQAYYAAQAQMKPGEAAGAEQVRIERRVVFDTIESIDPQTYEVEVEVVRREEEKMVGPEYGTEARLSELQARLDRQEQLLLEIRDGRSMSSEQKTLTADQARRDAELEALLRRANNPDALTRNDLNRLTQEVSDLNRELANMRGRLQDEERRRRRAEDRMEDYLRDQRAYTRDRDLDREFDRNRRDDRLTVQPNIITPTPAPERVIIRDTIYQDRTRTDTVRIVREATPVTRVVRDTVVRTNTVREVETVQLAAKEPIGFPTIFFANNSATLSSTHRNILSSMIEEMRDKGTYRVRLTGYASPSGNADYNQQLSARRAEAVKQGLLQMGIAESRIRLVAGGIDYQPSSPAAARRVEVQAIPE